MATEKSPRSRPSLRSDAVTGRSFIEDHHDYRPPISSTQGIDGIVETPLQFLTHRPSSASTNSGGPPARIKESGIIHTLSHGNCEPEEGTEKLVATLFYRSGDPRHPHVHPDSATHGRHSTLPKPELPDGAAPTTDMSAYPLEPPPPEPEPLDHLYGSYISQICLTSFLQMLDSLQHPYQRITSSHRCLDSQTQPRVMEVTFSPPPNPAYLTFEELRRHESVWRFEREWNVEVIFQRDTVFRKHKRLVVFDMDSTLIQQEVIDEIARTVGIADQVSAITSRAMNGELDFSASLRARCALLAGTPSSVFDTLQPRITLTPGAAELLRALNKLGFVTAVLSGGFMPLASWLAARLNITYAHANNLVLSPDGATLTGAVADPIVNAERKRDVLLQIAAQHGIAREQILAVGDGANDLLMLGAAGLGIAFNAKSRVQMEAPARLNSGSLRDVLFLLGFTKSELEELCR